MAANPAIDIPNLLYLYAELIDGARFDEAAALFDHARIVAGGHEIRGRDAIAGMWSQWIKLYDCGTPRIFEERSYNYVFRTASHGTMDNVALPPAQVGCRPKRDREPREREHKS